MTRKEAIEILFEIKNTKCLQDDEFYTKLPSMAPALKVRNIINDIFDDFESQKSCDGCKDEPAPGGTYPEICGMCARFYGDRFESKEK